MNDDKTARKKALAFLAGFLFHHPIFASCRCPLCEKTDGLLIFLFEYRHAEYLTGQCIYCRGTIFGCEAILRHLSSHPLDRKMVNGTEKEFRSLLAQYNLSNFAYPKLSATEADQYNAFLKIYGDQKCR